MAIAAEVFYESAIGVEGTYGVATPADLLLASMGFDLRPQGESNIFGPPGSKFDGIVSPNKMWSTGAINGFPSYSELQHILSTIFEGSVSVSGAVGTWTFISHSRAPDVTKSLTVEQGSDVAGEPIRATGVQARSINLTFDRNAGISIGGEIFGKALTHGDTPTPSPTGFAQVPILAKDVNVYLDRTDATDLGVTQLTDAFHVEFSVANKFGPKYVLDRANGLSPDGLVELKPTISSRFTHEANTAGLAMLDDFENGSTAWLRINAQSATNIPTTVTPYSLTVDMAVSVERPEGFRNEGGVHAAEFTLRGLLDTVWGNAFRIVLVNGQLSL